MIPVLISIFAYQFLKKHFLIKLAAKIKKSKKSEIYNRKVAFF